MAEDLQGLLERINEEGIKKSESQKDQILADAKAKADQIITDAKAEAAQIVEKAQQEQARLAQAGEDQLRQASRDIIVSLEEEIKTLLSALLKSCVAESTDAAFLAGLIEKLTVAYASGKGEVTKLEALVSKDDCDKLEALAKSKLAGKFKDGITIKPVPGIEAGVQVSFNGEAVFHDFTSESIVEMLSGYVNARIAEMLKSSGE